MRLGCNWASPAISFLWHDQVEIPRTNNFDLIRLLAASQVVIGHAFLLLKPQGSAALDNLMRWLFYFPGVPVFFTVSGFLVFWSFDRNSEKVGQFFKNRLLRIYPALWVCFAVTVALLFAFREISLSTLCRTDFWAWVLRQVTFVQFGIPDILRHWGSDSPNRALWTISVELQFYVLVPFIYFFLRRFGKRWALGWSTLFLGSIVAYTLACQLNAENIIRQLSSLCVVTYLFNFLIGVGFYKWWDRLRFLVENRFGYWLVAYLAFVLLFGKMLGWYHAWPYTPNPIRILGYTLLSITALSLAFSYRTVSDRFIKGFDMSYGVYIYHALVLNCFI